MSAAKSYKSLIKDKLVKRYKALNNIKPFALLICKCGLLVFDWFVYTTTWRHSVQLSEKLDQSGDSSHVWTETPYVLKEMKHVLDHIVEGTYKEHAYKHLNETSIHSNVSIGNFLSTLPRTFELER